METNLNDLMKSTERDVLESAFIMACGELSTYRDTDKHPEVQVRRLIDEARKDERNRY